MNKTFASLLVASLLAASSAHAQQPTPQPAAQPAPAAPQQQRSPLDVDPNSMVVAALQTAQLIDTGRSGEVWDGAASVAKSATTRDVFVQQLNAARGPLGQLQSRAWVSVVRQSAPAPTAEGGPPAGEYISVRFASRFAGGRTVTELVSFRLEDGGTWRVAGYVIQ